MQKILAFNASPAICELSEQLDAEGLQLRTLDATNASKLQPLENPAAVIISSHNEWEDAQNLCAEIRRSDWELPVLVISERTDPATKAWFLDLGADDYLEEPFVAEELIARLRSIIRRRTTRTNSASL